MTKIVKPCDVVNTIFGVDLFRVKGGRATYDEVWMTDGGQAFYLARVRGTKRGIEVSRRWIPADTEIEQLYEVR